MFKYTFEACKVHPPLSMMLPQVVNKNSTH